jgi:hypothetical protein
LAGAIVAMASPMGPSHESQVVLSLSPVVGLALIAVQDGNIPESYRTAIQASALTPALLFTFVFNGLYTMARRRVHDEAMVSASQPKETVSLGLQ